MSKLDEIKARSLRLDTDPVPDSMLRSTIAKCAHDLDWLIGIVEKAKKYIDASKPLPMKEGTDAIVDYIHLSRKAYRDLRDALDDE